MPPAPRTLSAANCAEPAKTIADITIAATLPITGAASTPKLTPTAKVGSTSGSAALIPRCIRRSVCGRGT